MFSCDLISQELFFYENETAPSQWDALSVLRGKTAPPAGRSCDGAAAPGSDAVDRLGSTSRWTGTGPAIEARSSALLARSGSQPRGSSPSPSQLS